ncbi:MAG: hypothetical protein QOG83_2686 [Alphaproteobacteria bacterium]|jgi:Xaa-Pro aminopeptidase|nr:hypothetical protein [Alphaproteobacteria bacterium]MEA2989975.1 hypothetical protein [Alphaproteobacteria bacterium]
MYTVHPTLLIGPADWQAERMPKGEFFLRIDTLWQTFPAAKRAIVYGDSRHHAELAYFTNLVPKLDAAVALLTRNGDEGLLVGGGPNMLDAARPLTWIEEIAPLGDGKVIGPWAAGDEQQGPEGTLSIGAGYMPTALRQNILGTIRGGDALPDATPHAWRLMRRKSPRELASIGEACAILDAAITAIAGAHRGGAGVTTAVLAGERSAIVRGAQDVRTLFSTDAGRVLRPFEGLIDRPVDPLQVYVAIRRFNYWAEGFAHFSRRPIAAAAKADEGLQLALRSIRPGTRVRDIASVVAAAIRPYRPHPVTEHAFATAIGLALEEPPYTDVVDAFEAGETYSLKVGASDGTEQHAIASAMIVVRDDGNEVLWIGPRQTNGKESA